MQACIVTATDAKYLPAACCAVISARRAGRPMCPIFLIVSDVPDDQIEAARRFLERWRAEAEFIRCEIDLSGYRADRWVSAAAYARLHLDEILGSEWDRVLYLDADTRVMAPLQPLLDAELHGQPLGAVDNCWDNDHVGRLAMTETSLYFNSGVLLFDWRSAAKYLSEVRQFASENMDLCHYWDQDALNKVMEGVWQPLDVRWNYGFPAETRLSGPRPFLRHFSTDKKPWGKKRHKCWFTDAIWYRRLLRKSPWPDFAQPITIGYIRDGLMWRYYKLRTSKRPRFRLASDGLRIEPASFVAGEEPVYFQAEIPSRHGLRISGHAVAKKNGDKQELIVAACYRNAQGKVIRPTKGRSGRSRLFPDCPVYRIVLNVGEPFDLSFPDARNRTRAEVGFLAPGGARSPVLVELAAVESVAVMVPGPPSSASGASARPGRAASFRPRPT